MTDKDWITILESTPKYISWEDKNECDYPEVFKQFQTIKRPQDILDRFTKLCMNIKLAEMNTKNSALPPVVIGVERDNQVWFFELRHTGRVGKNGVPQYSPCDLVHPIAKALNPNMYVVIAESWTTSFNKKDAKSYQYGDISKDPNREECVIIDGRTREGKKSTKIQIIKRKKNGSVEFDDLLSMMNVKDKPEALISRYDVPLEK